MEKDLSHYSTVLSPLCYLTFVISSSLLILKLFKGQADCDGIQALTWSQETIDSDLWWSPCYASVQQDIQTHAWLSGWLIPPIVGSSMKKTHQRPSSATLTNLPEVFACWESQSNNKTNSNVNINCTISPRYAQELHGWAIPSEAAHRCCVPATCQELWEEHSCPYISA